MEDGSRRTQVRQTRGATRDSSRLVPVRRAGARTLPDSRTCFPSIELGGQRSLSDGLQDPLDLVVVHIYAHVVYCDTGPKPRSHTPGDIKAFRLRYDGLERHPVAILRAVVKIS